MIAILAAATLMLPAHWVPHREPDPVPPPKSPLVRSFESAPSMVTLEAHFYCTVSVTDPHDQSTACLHYSPSGLMGDDVSQAVADAEARTKPGGCIVGVLDPHDGSTICVATK